MAKAPASRREEVSERDVALKCEWEGGFHSPVATAVAHVGCRYRGKRSYDSSAPIRCCRLFMRARWYQ